VTTDGDPMSEVLANAMHLLNRKSLLAAILSFGNGVLTSVLR
jgi:hypothetical protein